ncbi:unnamed protein product [marine sediment metagenome]|uniref:Uncharacterized protein n=1 Tax=marine sediment metagenome TaxID=412755 RepID=X0XLP9_9ZZZZ
MTFLPDWQSSYCEFKNLGIVNCDMGWAPHTAYNFRPARPALRDEAGGHF